MNSVMDLATQNKDRPPFVRFERRPIEDRAASVTQGHYVAKDLDYVLITPLGSKDVMIFKVPQWFENMKQDVANGRLPQEWQANFHKMYEAWKAGEELPLHGTPIKGWGLMSPAQQETLIRMNVRTVEDLAALNDEGIKRVGMGGVMFKNKAQAWLAQHQDKGQFAQEFAALKSENAVLRANEEAMIARIERLEAAHGVVGAAPAPAGISASDLLQDEGDIEQLRERYKAKFGKAPHPNINYETLKARVEE